MAWLLWSYNKRLYCKPFRLFDYWDIDLPYINTSHNPAGFTFTYITIEPDLNCGLGLLFTKAHHIVCIHGISSATQNQQHSILVLYSYNLNYTHGSAYKDTIPIMHTRRIKSNLINCFHNDQTQALDKNVSQPPVIYKTSVNIICRRVCTQAVRACAILLAKTQQSIMWIHNDLMCRTNFLR